MGSNWDDLITEAEAERFIGREQELDLFRREISLRSPRTVIFYITGQGGAGKSTLLGRYRALAETAGFVLADTDELQRDVPSVLGRFAHQFSEQGIQLKRFNERYKTYRQKMDEIENDPQAPQGLAALLGRTVVRASYVMGDLVPGLRRGLDYIPRESVETQASEWAEYVARKFSNKDEVALVREPTPVLTTLFFEDLNELALKRRFLLCFENFEATRQELQTWLLRLREYKPSLNITLAIAGRNPPGAQWDPLRRVTSIVHLDVFTEAEAEAFLDVSNITDVKRREEIIAYSNRLPVLMSWLAAPEGDVTEETTLPTQDIVERFLRWITDPAQRRVALVGAVPRFFNVDLLTCLLAPEESLVDVQATFEWLQTMPFVRQHTQGWRYHDVVRRMLLRYQRQTSPQAYRHLHVLLADSSDEKRRALKCSLEEQWSHEIWRAETLVWLYHKLAADPHGHWVDVIDVLVIAIRKRREFALEIAEVLDHEDLHDELTQAQKQLVQLVKRQLRAIEDGDFKDGLEMFEALCRLSGLSVQAKGYLFAYRGECFQQNEQWEKALEDFHEALGYVPEDAWTFASRGQTYRQMDRYEEALEDFTRAIALDEKDGWAITNRGQTYRQMKRYEEALKDSDRAIALDEKDGWALINRGRIYQAMKRYEEALRDYNRAIALDEKDGWALINRGETYRLMKRYEEALEDFTRTMALDEKDSWALTNRGETYRQMKRYEEALEDFTRAMALDEKDSWALINRGETYRLMKRYEEALEDFTRAITLDEKDNLALTNRGQTYQDMERYEEALRDYDRAIVLDEKDSWAFGYRGRTYQDMERYEEALRDYDHAIVLDEKNSWAFGYRGRTYQAMGRYEEALRDYDHAIVLDKEYCWAFGQRGQTYQAMERYEEALRDYDRAIALDEEDSWIFRQRGQTYQAMERYEEALRDYDHLIVLDEEDSEMIENRGRTYRLMERYEEALRDYDRVIALDIDKQDDWALYDRALLQLLSGRQDAFRRDINAAITIAQSKLDHAQEQSDDFYLFHFDIALYLLVEGSTEAAQAKYSQVLPTCQNVERLQVVADDLQEVFTIQPTNELAQQIRHQVETRIQELLSMRNL